MRSRNAVLGLVAVLATAAGAAGGVVAVRAGEALPGTTVAGVDVGGLGRADLRERLSTLADERTTGSLDLVFGDRTFPVDRAQLDVDVDLGATVDAALSAGRSDGLDVVLGPLLGRGEPVELDSAVDTAPLRARIDEVAAELDAEPFPGAILVADGIVTPQPPAEGRRLDRDRAVDDLTDALLTGREEPLPLPVDTQDPGTTPADVEAVAAAAREAISAPYRLASPEASLEVAPAELAPLLRAEPDAGSLRLGVDRPAFSALVERKAAALQRPAVPPRFAAPPPPVVDTQGDLTWRPQPAAVSVTPGSPGLRVDAAAAVEALLPLIGTAQHEGPLAVTVIPPSVGPEAAASTGISSLLGTFTTYFASGQPRASNIRRIAAVADDTYVAPGGTFSLNGVAGPRTRAKGYLEDGAIIDGELKPTVGGGVSQFATTLFNAAFFAGLPIEQHQPHSYYISRYPAGRESTVNYGSIDVVFRNDTGTGMVVKAWSTPRSVTVGIYSDNGGRVVTSTTGPRQPREGGGFRIEVTRTVSGGDGRGGTRVFRTTYNPPPD